MPPICSRIRGHVDRFVKGEELQRGDIRMAPDQILELTEISWAATKQSEIHQYRDEGRAITSSKSVNGS
jgi:hypothetical protein